MSLSDRLESRAVRRYRRTAWGYVPTRGERWANRWKLLVRVARMILRLDNP